MKVSIAINKEDIRDGRKYVCDACPVALATARALGWACSRVLAKTLSIDVLYQDGTIGYWDRCKTPQQLANWMAEYDSGQDVAPIKCDLEFKPIGVTRLAWEG